MAVQTKSTSSAEEKLRSLYALQLIDSRIDRIRVIRGELPLEVQDLEDEIEGLRTRLANQESAHQLNLQHVSAYRNQIEDSKALIAKYTEQQNNVRNNREYESLNNELEYQQLEIELCEKRIREIQVKIDAGTASLETSREKLAKREEDLAGKQAELAEIVAETQAEEESLLKLSAKLAEDIDGRLLASYQRIRQAAKNGLAVVPIERQASAGSFIKIPPQRRIDIAQRKRIIVDEHSGRILVDKDLADEVRQRIDDMVAKEMGSGVLSK